MKKLLLTTLIVLSFTVQSFGFDYSLFDFGQDNIFDYNNNWAPIDYPYGIGNLPSPGTYDPGGESFDLEGFNVASDQDYIYISLTNSFGYEHNGFRLGDLFIGVGDNQYQYAVDLQTHGNNGGLYEVSSWDYIQDRSDSYYSNATIREASGAHEMASGSFIGSVTSMMTFESGLELDYLEPGNGDTYVWELQIDRSLINGGDLSNLSFHVNVGCGNDQIDERYSFGAVPEPTTIVLFGLGLLGGAAYRRRKKGK